MIYFEAILNIFCIVVTIGVVVRDNQRRRTALFSFRNVFLAGYLYFQSFGFFSWILDKNSNGWWGAVVSDRNYQSSIMYGLMLNGFLLVFLIVYRQFPIKLKQQKLVSRSLQTPSYLMRLAVVMTVLSLTVWLMGQFAARDLLRHMSSGIGVTATGLATWALAYRIRNPVFIAMVAVIALLSLAPHLTDYGRRGIVYVAGVIAWVLFYRVTFKFNPARVFIVTILVGFPMLIVLAAFSEARVKRPDSTADAINYMMEADINKGMRRLATFQGAAPISIWCLENFPKPYDYRHCYTAKASVWFFVPRSIWPEKPPGLGVSIPRMAGMRGVGGLNVGAGLIGHACAEGGWYALILYAILLAIFLKWMDTLVLRRPSPLYQIPLASALGELFATARGEVNYFIDIMIISIITGFIVLKIVHYLSKPANDREFIQLTP